MSRGSGEGDTPILRLYGYVPPEKNIFRPGPLLQTPYFQPGLLQKTSHFSKENICLFHFSDLGCSRRPPFKKYMFLCYFQFQNPPRSLSPPFSNCGRHIYTTFMYEYPPPLHMYRLNNWNSSYVSHMVLNTSCE